MQSNGKGHISHYVFNTFRKQFNNSRVILNIEVQIVHKHLIPLITFSLSTLLSFIISSSLLLLLLFFCLCLFFPFLFLNSSLCCIYLSLFSFHPPSLCFLFSILFTAFILYVRLLSSISSVTSQFPASFLFFFLLQVSFFIHHLCSFCFKFPSFLFSFPPHLLPPTFLHKLFPSQ